MRQLSVIYFKVFIDILCENGANFQFDHCDLLPFIQEYPQENVDIG